MAVNPSIQLGTSGNWAIKEDNLLAYKQLGNKFFDREFDFSRGTRATFVGRNGLIQESGLTSTELVTNGDFATDSDWVKSGGATISGGQANIVGDGTSFTSIVQYSIFTIGKKYEVSVDVTISSGLGLKFQDGANNENIGFATTSGTYVFYFTGTSSADFVIGRRTGGTAFNSSVNNVSIREIQVDVPRIDFTDDTTGHLLLEPQSTNLITYSSDFSSAIWNANTDVFIDEGYLSPEGTLNATKVTKDGTNAKLAMFIGGTAPITKSIYARTVSGTGTAYFGEGSFTGVLSTVTEQWQRFEITVNGNNFYAVDFRGASTLTEVIIFGAQFEQQSYATSYIPTSGSTVTRNQELCNNSGTVNDFNSEEGVLYADISALADDGTTRRFSISDGTNNNRVVIGYSSSNGFQFVISDGGSVVLNQIKTVSDITQFNKIALSYKLNDCAIWINGQKVGVDTIATMPSGLNTINFNQGSSSENLFGKTKNLKVFKRALTDTELYLLTVTQYQSYQEMATALNYTL